jgi:hypothetical protein
MHGQVVGCYISHCDRQKLPQAHSGEETGAKEMSEVWFRSLHQASAFLSLQESGLRSIDVLKGPDAPPSLVAGSPFVLIGEIERCAEKGPDLVCRSLTASPQLPIVRLRHPRVSPPSQVRRGEFTYHLAVQRMPQTMPLLGGQLTSTSIPTGRNNEGFDGDTILHQICRGAANLPGFEILLQCLVHRQITTNGTAVSVCLVALIAAPKNQAHRVTEGKDPISIGVILVVGAA